MTTTSLILEELRQGPKTTSQLAEATGTTRNAVECALRYISDSGYGVSNLRRRGGHHEGLWQLTHDLEHPKPRRCAAEDCETLLSLTNPTLYCRRHLADAAYIVYLEGLSAALDDLLGVNEQLSVL